MVPTSSRPNGVLAPHKLLPLRRSPQDLAVCGWTGVAQAPSGGRRSNDSKPVCLPNTACQPWVQRPHGVQKALFLHLLSEPTSRASPSPFLHARLFENELGPASARKPYQPLSRATL